MQVSVCRRVAHLPMVGITIVVWVCPKIKYLTYVALRCTHGLMAKSMSQRQEAEVAIQERFARLNDSLSERGRRLFAASEAMAFGFGGVAAVSRATGM